VVTTTELDQQDGTIAIASRREPAAVENRAVDSMCDRQNEFVRGATHALRDFDPRPAVMDLAVRPA
jgi:hypothetical protein